MAKKCIFSFSSATIISESFVKITLILKIASKFGGWLTVSHYKVVIWKALFYAVGRQ